MYRSPVSGSSTTTVLPAFSSRFAICKAGVQRRAGGYAREQAFGPGQRPGRLIGLALRHAHDFVEQRDVEHIGHKPRADAHQPVGAGLPPESTADPAGSTAVIFTSGFRSFR